MIGPIIGLAILGLCLYLLKTYVPMDPAISTLITVVVVLCCIAWLLGAFGVVDMPLPRFHR